METSLSNLKQAHIIQRPNPISILRKLARPDRSLSPTLMCDKSLTRLPPLQQQSKSSNTTPPPRLYISPTLVQPPNRVKSITKSSLFPEIPKHVPRAPSVNDLLPPLTKFFSAKEVICSKCKKKSNIVNETSLDEYKIWGTCVECQNVLFTTPITNEYSDAITFQRTGEFCEFALEAKIGFWLQGHYWSSAEEYIESCGKSKALKAILQKVKQHPRLEQLLKSTAERELIYFLPGDNYWGVSFNGIGGNHLGKLLMEIRKHLKSNVY